MGRKQNYKNNYSTLLGMDVELTETTSETQNHASDKAIKNEDLVWNKGAWLSLLANIEDQQQYLGPLTFIW